MQVTLPGTSMPWDVGINPSFGYGINDGTAPLVVCPNLTPGQLIYLEWISGTVAASNARPAYDANGDTTFIANGNNNGATGTYFPSLYTPGDWSRPEYLICVMGAFVNASGILVPGGVKFVGNGPITLITPAGASQLQLGANDDHFADNIGSWVLEVNAVQYILKKYSFPVSFVMKTMGGSGQAQNTTGSGQIFPVGF